MTKGVLLAGGSGTRLWPITRAMSKQLVPVFDKPMIYYPLSTLISAGIGEIMIITTETQQSAFQRLLGSGRMLGVEFTYATQQHPRGIAEALLIAEDFIAGNDVVLALGDNIFHGGGVPEKLSLNGERGARIFAYAVQRPQDYGVVEFSSDGQAVSLREKPEHPRSPYAVPGMYVYDSRACVFARNLSPSARGELEITDINRMYMAMGELQVSVIPEEAVWLDAGTIETLAQASAYVEAVQTRTGLLIGSPEEAAWRAERINAVQLRELARMQASSSYGQRLLSLLP